MTILNIVETAFRGTIEEQDDTVVWTIHAMRKAGQDLTVVLRGNAVCHATRGQDASGLAFGGKEQTNPVDLAGDLEKLMAAGVPVYVVQDDVAARGLDPSDLIAGVIPLGQGELVGLFEAHETVWHW